ncbi:hypothetical protein IC235_15960 [Hymenobacter sp. BT664]|uniref:Uncharacterized protein n=1 Tax=Hymenobacter montanus TaxID=2771359 RepID=A0A927BFT7_9BACT|nr:hypothetical protein [Hymenobacter montanus]MBD2769384.1 hypothetical protein [Hymenobacter montanus]
MRHIGLVTATSYPHSTSSTLPHSVQRGPEATDQALIQAIEALTQQEKNFWSQPLEYDRRGAGHRFFQYPAMMLPVVQRKIIQLVKAAAPRTQTLLDPFMGSGTALAAGMLNGLDCYGQDINPMSILLAKVKAEAFNQPAYQRAAERLWKRVKADTSTEITAAFPNLDKWFKPTVAQELSKLVRAIRQERQLSTRRLFWVTLAETVRLTSNDRTSTFKLHARSAEDIAKRDPSPLKTFEQLFAQNTDDIAFYAEQLTKQGYLHEEAYTGRVSISVLDSSKRIKLPAARQPLSASAADTPPGFDLVVSSPPYGDNRTTVPYGQHAYLPLQWIDFADIDPAVSPDCLATTHEIDNRSLGGQRNTVTKRDQKKFSRLSPAFEANIQALLQTKPTEVKKVVCFVRDLNEVLKRCAQAVKPNGYLVWTIGNRKVGGLEIHNNLILANLLAHYNIIQVYKIERSIQSKRMAARNKSTTTMTKEEILIFRKK